MKTIVIFTGLLSLFMANTSLALDRNVELKQQYNEICRAAHPVAKIQQEVEDTLMSNFVQQIQDVLSAKYEPIRREMFPKCENMHGPAEDRCEELGVDPIEYATELRESDGRHFVYMTVKMPRGYGVQPTKTLVPYHSLSAGKVSARILYHIEQEHAGEICRVECVADYRVKILEGQNDRGNAAAWVQLTTKVVPIDFQIASVKPIDKVILSIPLRSGDRYDWTPMYRAHCIE